MISSVDLRDRVSEEAVRACSEALGDRLRSLILTGSVARDEATVLEEGKGSVVAGDAEFVVVLQEQASLPDRAEIAAIERRASSALAARGIRVEISFSAAHEEYLRRLEPHIFAYELRTCGRVLSGDPAVLSLIPTISPDRLSPEDAWRLLCNRMIEVVESAAESEITSPAVIYRLAKLDLDMATSLLVFAGCYAPTYSERMRQIQGLKLGAQDASALCLAPLAERVGEATRFKLTGGAPPRHLTEPGGLFESVSAARRLWRWETIRLAAGGEDLDDRALMRRWTARQPFARRWRGWLAAARQQGVNGALRSLPRWIGRCWGASPRYRVYAAGCQLFFSLPALVSAGSAGAAAMAAIESELPVLWPLEGAMDGWRRAARQIARNYRAFLVETRA